MSTDEEGEDFVDRNEEQFEYTTRQAGKLGGLTTFSRFGVPFYRRIGRKGQASFTAKYTVEDRRRWGKFLKRCASRIALKEVRNGSIFLREAKHISIIWEDMRRLFTNVP